MSANQFPLRIAKGSAFCNRHEERSKLKSLIAAGHHIWLQAPRRLGKTSLLAKLKEDFTETNTAVLMHRVDLAFSIQQQEIITSLCDGVIALINQILKTAPEANDNNFLQIVISFFQRQFLSFNPQIRFDRGLPTVGFQTEPSLDMLKKSLITLDEVATKHQYRAVLVIDEFQQVGKSASTAKLQSDHSIEGTIRHCLELADNVNYIFCGSEGSLMEQAMESESRPLYNHTFKLALKRMSSVSYQAHIGKLWLERWKHEMPGALFEMLMSLTQHHPYYVNALCALLWLNPKQPNDESIITAWEDVVDQDSSEFKSVVLKLKKNEVNLLKALAKHPTTEPTGAGFAQYHSVPAGSIMSTLNQLMEKDLIYRDDNLYRLINPALAYQAAHH